MPVVQNQFLSRLRLRLGNPSVQELADAVLLEAANVAFTDYSLVKPHERQPLLITLQPYQEAYTLSPAPKYVLDVIPAAPTTASARAFGNEFRALELDLVSFQISDLFVQQMKVSEYREMFEQIEWHYDDPPTLTVQPSPVNSMQAIVLVGEDHTWNSFPSADFEILMAGAKWRAYEMWAAQRDSLTVMQAPASIGTLQLENGERLKKYAEEQEKVFKQRIGWDKPYIGQG